MSTVPHSEPLRVTCRNSDMIERNCSAQIRTRNVIVSEVRSVHIGLIFSYMSYKGGRIDSSSTTVEVKLLNLIKRVSIRRWRDMASLNLSNSDAAYRNGGH
ncbi:MAG: hypothetical protein CVT76_06820 [Alphaproteobacteria bacterium HGW-Alphaproteobacteria-15]|nr:MAG: hypothetical protein CVT76_06820 [Alphaproteobacteria bacterium HGW-Alphaproteobacteria-15]